MQTLAVTSERRVDRVDHPRQRVDTFCLAPKRAEP
jgi:hypothetical protein